MTALRRLHRAFPRIMRWVRRVLDVWELADWKTWVWYSILGTERVTTALLVWAKRRTHCPAHLVLKDGRFYIAASPPSAPGSAGGSPDTSRMTRWTGAKP